MLLQISPWQIASILCHQVLERALTSSGDYQLLQLNTLAYSTLYEHDEDFAPA